MLALPAVLGLIVCSAGQTVLLDFYGDRCPPCRAMDPLVQQLIAQGYPVQKINVEQRPEIARSFGVTSIPCFVMLVDGREVDRAVGPQSPDRLLQMLQRAAPPPTGPARASPTASDLSATTSLPPGSAGPNSAAIRPNFSGAGSVSGGSSPAYGTAAAARDPFGSAATAASPPAAVLPARPAATPAGLASTAATVPGDDHLLAATVRLRVVDPTGISKGTGTIVDSRQGHALVVTCAHIFRDSQGKGQIEVDLFGPNRGKTVPGRLIDFDLNNDVAVLSIEIDGPVAAARIAPQGYRVGPGDPVISCGCNHGADATLLRSRITAVDRYLNWPNLSIAGESVEGRSGGGLFTDDGLLIGVCNARDPQLREGLYSALPAIHQLLDRNRLSFVYQQRGSTDALAAAPASPPGPAVPRSAAPSGALNVMPTAPTASTTTDATTIAPTDAAGPAGRFAQNNPASRERETAAPSQLPLVLASGLSTSPAGGSFAPPPSAAPAASGELTPHEQAALEELRKRLRDGAEVICVVRPRNDPQAKSEVIVLDRVSPAFFQQLYADSRPKPPQPMQPGNALAVSGGALPAAMPVSMGAAASAAPSAAAAPTAPAAPLGGAMASATAPNTGDLHRPLLVRGQR